MDPHIANSVKVLARSLIEPMKKVLAEAFLLKGATNLAISHPIVVLRLFRWKMTPMFAQTAITMHKALNVTKSSTDRELDFSPSLCIRRTFVQQFFLYKI